MEQTVIVGKRHVPVEQIALIEPFNPETQLPLPTERTFHARIVFVDRDSVLTEEPLAQFVEKYGFRLIEGDGIATNPGVHFSVESFVPAKGFTPTRDYRSRLLWRDLNGERQSRLLLSEPEKLLSVAVRGGKADGPDAPPKAARRQTRRKTTRATPTQG
jgi:hypothetical protein